MESASTQRTHLGYAKWCTGFSTSYAPAPPSSLSCLHFHVSMWTMNSLTMVFTSESTSGELRSRSRAAIPFPSSMGMYQLAVHLQAWRMYDYDPNRPELSGAVADRLHQCEEETEALILYSLLPVQVYPIPLSYYTVYLEHSRKCWCNMIIQWSPLWQECLHQGVSLSCVHCGQVNELCEIFHGS